jgi:hypothetical protein
MAGQALPSRRSRLALARIDAEARCGLQSRLEHLSHAAGHGCVASSSGSAKLAQCLQARSSVETPIGKKRWAIAEEYVPAPRPRNGVLRPDTTSAGLGLPFRESDAHRFRV